MGTALTEKSFSDSGAQANRKTIFAVPGIMEPQSYGQKVAESQHKYVHRYTYDDINYRTETYCCKTGYELWSKWMELDDRPFCKADALKTYKAIYAPCPDHVIPKGHHTGNGKPKGIFAGTLTMSPKWETNEEEMVSAIKKIMRQKTCPVKRYVWYLEYTEENVPHVHFIYETDKGGRITQQTFKRQWKYWDESTPCGRGHVGGYHKHCAKEDDYLEYISKDKGRHENTWTIKQ